MTDTPRVLLILLSLGVVGMVLFRMGKGQEQPPLPIVSWTGATMGTTYQVQLAGVTLTEEDQNALVEAVDAELLAVNEAMSTYMPDSEISRFNRQEADGVPFPISERFREVMRRSIEVYEQSGGAFDPTLEPLISLWGFGAESSETEEPTAEQIEQRLTRVGLNKVVLQENTLRKTVPGLELNLSAIAKGYGVDRVAALLQEAGYTNIYVEIGGEVVCEGVNARRIPWVIGVQLPEREAGSSLIRRLSLHNRALATSGDYRNYLGPEAEHRHHILDPRTGRPAGHTLASVSVLAADCMTADAVATALYVMGTREGMEWLQSRAGMDALFIDRSEEGFRFTSTPGFEEALIPESPSDS